MGTRHYLLAASAAALAVISLCATARAEGRKSTESYVFDVAKVELAEGVAAPVEEPLRAALSQEIEGRAELHAAVDADAPDPEKEPAAFKRFLARKRLRAFKVNVEVTEYQQAVEPVEGGQRLAVQISLRLFGETIPDRVMAFTGGGSAAVKIDIGKRVRDRDRKYANAEAIQLAVKDAVSTSLAKLRAPKKKKKKRGRKKR